MSQFEAAGPTPGRRFGYPYERRRREAAHQALLTQALLRVSDRAANGGAACRTKGVKEFRNEQEHLTPRRKAKKAITLGDLSVFAPLRETAYFFKPSQSEVAVSPWASRTARLLTVDFQLSTASNSAWRQSDDLGFVEDPEEAGTDF